MQENKKTLTIPYFPTGMRYCAPLPIIAGIYLILVSHYVWWGLVLDVLGVLIITTKYVTEINLGKKNVRDYLSVLAIPLQEEIKNFGVIDRIVITKANSTQAVRTRVQHRDFSWSDFTATVVFDNDTLDLLTRQSKNELLTGIRPFAEFLGAGVEDLTTTEPYWIDMTRF